MLPSARQRTLICLVRLISGTIASAIAWSSIVGIGWSPVVILLPRVTPIAAPSQHATGFLPLLLLLLEVLLSGHVLYPPNWHHLQSLVLIVKVDEVVDLVDSW